MFAGLTGAERTVRGPSVLHVCSLGSLADVTAQLGNYDLLSLLSPGHDVAGSEGRTGCHRHLSLTFHDIPEHRPGLISPGIATVQTILDFGRQARAHPLLVHCWAGISRSSAAAYALACDRNPGLEREIALDLRARAPFATPNRLMVALADDLLGRQGRMVDAIAGIGRGAEAREGLPYILPLDWPLR